MTLQPGFVGFTDVSDANLSVRIDYSCVFGTTTPAVRHDPHVHDQTRAASSDLMTISDLIRDKADRV